MSAYVSLPLYGEGRTLQKYLCTQSSGFGLRLTGRNSSNRFSNGLPLKFRAIDRTRAAERTIYTEREGERERERADARENEQKRYR